MTRLLKVELRRLFSRRLTSIAILGALVITGILLFGAYEQAKPLSAAEMTSQRASFDSASKDWKINGPAQIEGCLQGQADAQKTDPKADFGCAQMEPKWENWGKPVAQFHEVMPPALRSGAYLLAVVGFLLGAGFVAAEFSSGSMGNWLTFEPRRMRVYASKLGAAGLALIPITLGLLGILMGGVWLIVSQLASTTGTTGTVWVDLAEMAGRSVALALVAAVVGAAFGMLLRHTAAVLGLAMGYLVLVEGILGGLLQSRGGQPWLMRLNVDAWLNHGTSYFINKTTVDDRGNMMFSQVEKLLSFGRGSAYLGILVVLLVGLAALVFRRRDVT